MCQWSWLSLPSACIQDPTFSHHLFHCESSPNHHQLSLALLPPNWFAYLHFCVLQSDDHKATIMIPFKKKKKTKKLDQIILSRCLKPSASLSLTQNKNPKSLLWPTKSSVTWPLPTSLTSSIITFLLAHSAPAPLLPPLSWNMSRGCFRVFALPSKVPISRPLLRVPLACSSFSIFSFCLIFFRGIFHLTYYSYLFVNIRLLLKSISQRMPVFFTVVSPGPKTVLCLW